MDYSCTWGSSWPSPSRGRLQGNIPASVSLLWIDLFPDKWRAWLVIICLHIIGTFRPIKQERENFHSRAEVRRLTCTFLGKRSVVWRLHTLVSFSYLRLLYTNWWSAPHKSSHQMLSVKSDEPVSRPSLSVVRHESFFESGRKYETLSNTSRRKVCQGSGTDHKTQTPGEPLSD